jgi:hypothetical protein
MILRICKNSFGDEMRHSSDERRSLNEFKGAKRILWSAKCWVSAIMMGMMRKRQREFIPTGRIHPFLATTSLCVLQKEK